MPAASTAAPLKRSHWPVRRCASFEEMRRLAIADWQRLGSAARNAATWELVVEAWRAQGRDPHELRLQRTVAILRKA